MRIFIIALMLVSLVCSPAFADDAKDLVDTSQGLTYTKPDGWTVVGAKKGAVSALQAAGDEKSQIEFRFAKIVGEPANSYFTTFHSSLIRAKLERVKDGESTTYGKLSGKLTEYSAGKGDKQKSLFVFEFTTDKGAWLIVGMFDTRRRDQYLTAYEAMIGGVQTE